MSTFITWFFSLFKSSRQEEREAYLRTLESLVATQSKTQELVLKAVEGITLAQAKQAEAINTHLSLFKMVEAPSSVTLNGEQDNAAIAASEGFPEFGTAEEQAKWFSERD